MENENISLDVDPASVPSPAPVPKSDRPVILVSTIIFLLLAVGASAFYFGKMASSPKQVACTMEAKVCPDGSSVGRTGPKCEFAPCPSPTPSADPTASWKTYIDTKNNYSFKYPSDWYDQFHISQPCSTCGGTSTGFFVSVRNNSSDLPAKETMQKDIDENNKGFTPPPGKFIETPSNFSGYDASFATGFVGAGSPGIQGYIVKNSLLYQLSFDGVEEQTQNQILSTFKFTN